MKKKVWSKRGTSILVIAAFLLVGATVSFALPLQDEALTNWTIDYTFNGADQYAGQLGAFYFSGVAGNMYSRSDFQVAIWSYYNIGSNHRAFGSVGSLLDDLRWRNPSTSGLAIARSRKNQDQLVHFPEPANMFLLGLGMIGLGVVGRKKFLKK
jgi:hypothetical protein